MPAPRPAQKARPRSKEPRPVRDTVEDERPAKRENEEDTAPAEDGASEVLARTSLSLAGHALPPLQDVVKTLVKFTKLRRLDLSNMEVSDDQPDGLSDLRWLALVARKSKKRAAADSTPFGERLTWLNVSGNPALGSTEDGFTGLEVLTALHGTYLFLTSVFNASHCRLPKVPAALSAWHGLKALVLSYNELEQLPAVFPHLPDLNTLVLSNNRLRQVPKTLPSSLPALKKLSLSHNQLEGDDALPDFSVCSHLREVRLCGNRALTSLPAHLATWGRGVDGGAPGLVLLDIGDCGLRSWKDLAPLVQGRAAEGHHGLANLSAKGNPFAEADDYRSTLLAALPRLRILDQTRLVPKKTEPRAAAHVSRDETEDAPVAAARPPRAERAARQGGATSAPRAERPKVLGDKFLVLDAAGPAEAPKHDKPRPAKHDKPKSLKSGTTAERPPTQRRHERPSSDTSGPSTRRKHTLEEPEAPAPKRAREAEADAKKPRKRSGRGPKRRGVAASTESSAAEPAMKTFQVEREPPHATDAPSAEPVAADKKPKKVRRKKGSRPVELDMDAGAPTEDVQEPPALARRSPTPPPHASGAPATGVVEVVDVARPRATAASAAALLGRRDDVLGGW